MTTDFRAGQLVARYLPVSEHWIHDLITASPAIDSIVLNRGARENDALFPGAQTSLGDLAPEACLVEASSWLRSGRSSVLLQAARDFGCQVMHAHFGTEGVLGLPLARTLDVPLVTSFYGYDASSLPRDPAWRRSLAALFEHGTLFCAEGPALAARLVALGCPPQRIHLMPLPVRSGGGPQESLDRPHVLVCGRLVDKKGVDDALRTLARARELAATPFRCTVIGSGPLQAALVALAKRLDLDEVVTFAGSVGPDLLRWHMASTSVVLQMSRVAEDGDTEGGAPVILSEAMAHGIPCVATTHADIPVIVSDGESGLLVSERDWHAAGRALADLLDAPARRQAMGRAGRATARREWAPAICGDRLEACYREAIRLGPVRSARGVAVSLPFEIAVDLRRRGADSRGLTELLRRARTSTQKSSVLRALAAVHDGVNAPERAARCYASARRLHPAEAGLALEEGRRWLLTPTPQRAVHALADFVRRHEDREYARSLVFELVGATAEGLRRAAAVFDAAGDAAGHLAASVARAAVQPDVPAEALAQAYRRATERLRRPATSASDRRLLEGAAALLFAAARRRGVALRSPIEHLRTPVARYRIASSLESGTQGERRTARRIFERLAVAAPVPDLRAGSAFHLALEAQREGLFGESARWARLALASNPDHGAARELLQTLDSRA
jgi:colanic acid/amylovoran biosynthesis glycosyltransferase